MTNTDHNKKKPGPVKAVKILIFIKLLIAVAFFIIFKLNDIQVGDVGPKIILYTAIGFAVMLIPILIALNKRKLVSLRILLLVDLLIAIPASAFISIALSLVSIGLTFTKSFKNHFTN